MRTKDVRKSARLGGLHRLVALLASACLVGGGAAGLVIGSASAGAAPACDVIVDANAVQSAITTIQGGIDAATSGNTVCLWPGLYNQDQALNRDPNTGGTGANNFNIFVGTPVTILGLDAAGNAITSAPQGATPVNAPVVEAAASEPTFGSSNIFVQAANVTISGLEINGTPNDIAKSVEIAGNGSTVTDTAFAPSTTSGGVGIYISDFHFDPSGSGTSTVTTYHFTDNTFDGDQNESAIYVASGAGWTGPTSGRVISGNAFSNMDDAMDFAGPGAQPWLVYPVGAATITGNTFSSIARRHLLVWGDGGPGVGYISPDWCATIAGNTFDAGSFIWQGTTVCPSGAARTWASGAFTNIAGLYSTIQRYGINKSLSGDTVQVLPGTYDEALTIGHALTLRGANAGVAGTAARGPESLVKLIASEPGSIFNITTPNQVTIDGFRAQFAGTEQNGGLVLSLAASNHLTFKNNLVDNSTYVNSLVFDDSAATSTFTNNKFTAIGQTGSPGTGVIAPWGTTGGAQAVVTITGNTFSQLTDQDGVPAINLNTVSGTVSGNTFSDIHQYGILLADTLGNLSISGNLFDNIHNDTPMSSGNRGSGIRTFAQPNFVGPVTVTGNTFSNSYHGVRVANDGSPADISNGNFKVIRNNIATSNTSAGISVATGTVGTLDGTCNWWGQTSGPAPAQTEGTVTTTPFLRSSNLAAQCPATVPSAPAPAFAVPYNDHGAKVVWRAPTSNGGSAITGYRIVPYVAGVAQPAQVFNSTATTQFITGLTDGSSYQFTVAARNAVGFGPASAKSPAMIAGAPGQPGTPTVTRPASGSLRVAFAKPMANGAAITSFTATCASSNGGVTQNKTGTASPITVTGLTPGRSYRCTVKATNSRGTGPVSDPSPAITA